MFEKIKQEIKNLSRRNKAAALLFFISALQLVLIVVAYNVGPLDPWDNIIIDTYFLGSFVVPFISACCLYDPKNYPETEWKKIEDFFFVSLLVISAFFFFQEYFYILIPNHKPFWIGGYPNGIPLTIIGIIGLGIFFVWYILRGKKLESPKEELENV